MSGDSAWEASHHLQPHTLLHKRYMVERVIGEGGFGISYLGTDISQQLKVAIKEYYPSGFAMRNSSESLSIQTYNNDKSKSKFFKDGQKRFIEEAQRLARFYHLPGIVSVKDFFNENATSYIVMEYVEGASLRAVLANMGGRMSEADVLRVMKPVISSMAELHKKGVIHRDIAPDNIMVQPNGNVKLLDFGAARDIIVSDQSSVAILKHGYAPEEQYDSNRKRQGAWTDVYAMCATIFRAIEGVTPPDAISRLRDDKFAGFSSSAVSENTQRVIMKGLSFLPGDRWQSMEQLAQMLYPDSLSQESFTTYEPFSAIKAFIIAVQHAVLSFFAKLSKLAVQAGPVGIRGIAGQYNTISFPIADKIVIGRNPAICNVLFSPGATGISSRHCEIIRIGNVLQVIDKGSSYGTFVRNEKLTANSPMQIRQGDIIYLGDESNSFVVY